MRNIGLLLGKETVERRKWQKLKKSVTVWEDTLGSAVHCLFQGETEVLLSQANRSRVQNKYR